MRYDLVVVEHREVGIPFAARADGELESPAEPSLLALVPAIFAVRHNCFPLRCDGEVLAVAMAAPSDRRVLKLLRDITGCHIQPLLATRAQIRAAIARAY